MSAKPETPLWVPSDEVVGQRRLSAYADWLKERFDVDFDRDYTALHRWSIDHAPEFWRSIIEYHGLAWSGSLEPEVEGLERLPGAAWFPGLKLNYAENLLRAADDEPALLAINESGETREISYRGLRRQVKSLQDFLRSEGVASGDRVAAILPNIPEAVAAMLGAASLGVTWSSVSPDFGSAGILDRLGQVAPKILFVCDRYVFGGKSYDVREKIAEVARQLPGLKHIVLVAGDEEGTIDGTGVPVSRWEDLMASPSEGAPDFVRLPFAHPLYIVFTSGTTGMPKCIIHSAGGTLIQLLKEHALHCDLGPGDVAFFPTTLGWMMWNWLVNGLATGACLLLYDGSPAHPGPTVLLDLAVRHRVTLLGLASALIENYRKAGLDVRETHDFSRVRLIFAGGSVLSREAFHYAQDHLAPGTWLASCSGGTDILSCFICTNPWGPVWAGELQAPALGMDVQVFDDAGHRVIGEKGELVCCSPAPPMPIGFLDDEDGKRFHEAYFDRFPGIWAHGDFVEQTVHGGFVIYGRSDTVLNPGGVRIGTAEIYRQVDRIREIEASVVVGLERDDDIIVALYVILKSGYALDGELVDRIKSTIRAKASPRHVPKVIRQVTDIPRTRSGKIAESAVREVANGRPVKQLEALANPEALKQFSP